MNKKQEKTEERIVGDEGTPLPPAAAGTSPIFDRGGKDEGTPLPAARVDEVFVYCGPSLPGARLNENTILRGSREAIRAAYRAVFLDYPQAEKLVVPVARVAAMKRRLRNGGELYSKYYQDIASAVRGKKGEQ